MNSLIGQILLWMGFLSGALASVFATANYARLGVTVTQAKDHRVIIERVEQTSTAYQSGLRSKDELLAFNDEVIESASAFGKIMGGFDSATPAKFAVRRGGEVQTIEVPVKSTWSTINWTWYLISAGICLLGIGFLHAGRKPNAHHAERLSANLEQIKSNLADLVVNTQRLQHDIKGLQPGQILAYIEGQLHDDLRDFADGRDSITAEHGLELFARVMTQFASGERAINRAWSASADGYVEEAASCVDHALTMFQSAEKLLQSA